MDKVRHITGSAAFYVTQLSMARAFLDIAQMAPTPEVLARNVRCAATALAAVSRGLAVEEIDSDCAQEIEARVQAMDACLVMLSGSLQSQHATATGVGKES
jgi:hypothetical protein